MIKTQFFNLCFLLGEEGQRERERECQAGSMPSADAGLNAGLDSGLDLTSLRS